MHTACAGQECVAIAVIRLLEITQLATIVLHYYSMSGEIWRQTD